MNKERLFEYLRDYKSMPTRTLAALIINDNQEEDYETIRSKIRYYRGKNGSKKLRALKNKEFIETKTRSMTPFTNSRAHKLEVFKLPTSIKKVLFLSDIHIPYQDTTALNLALRKGKEEKVDCIWLNGDVLDMYHASDHEKHPDHAMIWEEFQIAKEFFEYLRKNFPKAQIYFKEGNHERRWKRNLMRNAPMLLGCREFELPFILELEKHKIHWIENETLVKFGKLNVIHGNEFKGGGGVNPARALYLKAKSNVIAGDKHKTGENTEGSLDGKIVTTWSVGCLCELNPKYLPFAHVSWNHGFSLIEMNKDDFHVQNFRIFNGKVL